MPFSLQVLKASELGYVIVKPVRCIQSTAIPGQDFAKGSGQYMLHTVRALLQIIPVLGTKRADAEVIVHSGGVSSGHYYTFVRSLDSNLFATLCKSLRVLILSMAVNVSAHGTGPHIVFFLEIQL